MQREPRTEGDPQAPTGPAAPPAHWRANLRLTALLLALWFTVTFVVGWFARDLDFDFFGWPFGYWVGAQGAVLTYCAITWIYAWRMDRLDREHGLSQAPREAADTDRDFP